MGCLQRPCTGRVWVEGAEVTHFDEDERTAVRRVSIGYVFQESRLMPVLTAAENVALGLRLRGERGARLTERSRAALARVGLASRLDALPAHLSGGERQRVAIARAVAHEPALLLADEPTASLDSKSGQQIAGLLRDLGDRRRTVVIVTHDPRLERYADRIVRLEDGQVTH
jgi:putative ABC transport system ATP-binding protein